MKITVDITETLSRGVAVDADSNEEALERVEKEYNNSVHVLDSSDYCGVEFSVEDESASVVITLDKGFNPHSLILIKTGNEAETREGKQTQVAQAAYIDGYSSAAGELSRFITWLYKTDKETAPIVHNVLKALIKQQNTSYNTMCNRLNDKAYWDEMV